MMDDISVLSWQQFISTGHADSRVCDNPKIE
jgi:hypothetical protein